MISGKVEEGEFVKYFRFEWSGGLDNFGDEDFLRVIHASNQSIQFTSFPTVPYPIHVYISWNCSMTTTVCV